MKTIKAIVTGLLQRNLINTLLCAGALLLGAGQVAAAGQNVTTIGWTRITAGGSVETFYDQWGKLANPYTLPKPTSPGVLVTVEFKVAQSSGSQSKRAASNATVLVTRYGYRYNVDVPVATNNVVIDQNGKGSYSFTAPFEWVANQAKAHYVYIPIKFEVVPTSALKHSETNLRVPGYCLGK